MILNRWYVICIIVYSFDIQILAVLYFIRTAKCISLTILLQGLIDLTEFAVI